MNQIMRILINSKQLKLFNRFTITKNGLHHNDTNLIQESRLPTYLVSLYVQGHPCELRIGAYSSSAALGIARKLFGGKATITGNTTLIR